MTSEKTESSDDLPQSFQVKCLGRKDAKGLWGIKHTRKPVDAMVTSAKKSNAYLPLAKLIVSKDGVSLLPLQKGELRHAFYAIDAVSYGVQDLVYTRVFSMIIVRETRPKLKGTECLQESPFECVAFLCDSRQSARNLTYALATAFKSYSSAVKASGSREKVKNFAIDLRTPEEIAAEMNHILLKDSEA